MDGQGEADRPPSTVLLMDSITQITLGAAVGEVVLGKKLGNRAMLWGAFAGTIPDLDVLANLVTDNVSSTAFHRAITHSIFFAFIAPLALGWLVHRLYDGTPRSNRVWARDFGVVLAFFIIINAIGALALPIPVSDVLPIGVMVSVVILFVLGIAWWRRQRRNPIADNPSQLAWTNLFFWTIFTHPLLDACTIYGTQLLQPFSDFRVGLDNISVADPAYTLPFLICLIIASRMTRGSRRRAWFNWAGIAISSAYLVFTFFNKQHVDTVFENSLKTEELSYSRFCTTPTIFNNILWQGVADGDSVFYHGTYSLLDKEERILRFNYLPKNYHLLEPYQDQRAIKMLKWFSKDFYSVTERKDGRLQINQLQYGLFGEEANDEQDYIFKFILEEDETGELHISHDREVQPDSISLGDFWTRLKGI